MCEYVGVCICAWGGRGVRCRQHVLLWGVYDYYAALCDAYVPMCACVSVPLCLSVSLGIPRATCFSLAHARAIDICTHTPTHAINV